MSKSDMSDSELGEKLDEHLRQLEAQTVFDNDADLGADKELANLVEDLHFAAALFEDQPLDVERIGKYQIEKVIGRGGQSTTLLAEDTDLQRKVVLKVYQRLESAAQQEAILQEGRMLCRVDSPYVVQCYSAEAEVAESSDVDNKETQSTDSQIDGEETGETQRLEFKGLQRPYLVLKYIEGTPLDTRLRLGNVADEEIRRIMKCMFQGMQVVHEQGVYHRDVKPGNIVLNQDDVPILIDFGLAVGHTESVAEPRSGTAAYMSPEQARGIGVDGRSDIFGLGAVMYHMLTGFPPYRAENPKDTIRLAREGEIEAPEKLRQGLDPKLSRICMRCLAADPADRYQTPAEALADLEVTKTGFRSFGLVAATAGVMAVLLAMFFLRGSFLREPTTPEISVQINGGERQETGLYQFSDLDEVSLAVTANQPGYAYVFSIEGKKYRQLYPNAIQPLRKLEPNETLVVPQAGVARINLSPSTETELFRVVFTEDPWIGFSIVESTRGSSVFNEVEPDKNWQKVTEQIRQSMASGATRSAEIELVAREGRSSEILDEKFIPFRVESSFQKRVAARLEKRKNELLARDPAIQERIAWSKMPYSRRLENLQIFDNKESNVPQIKPIIHAKAARDWKLVGKLAAELATLVRSEKSGAENGQFSLNLVNKSELIRFCADALDSSGRSKLAVELRREVLARSSTGMFEKSQRIEFADDLARSQTLAEDEGKLSKWREADAEFAGFLVDIGAAEEAALQRIDRCLQLRKQAFGDGSTLFEPLFWRAAWLGENEGFEAARYDMERALAIAESGYTLQFNRFANLWNRNRETGNTRQQIGKKQIKTAVYEFASANLNPSRVAIAYGQNSDLFSDSSFADFKAVQGRTFQLFEIRRQVQQVRIEAWQGNTDQALKLGLEAREAILDKRGNNNLELCQLDQQLAALYRQKGNLGECRTLLRTAWKSSSAALKIAIEEDNSIVTYLSKFTWQLFSEMLATMDLTDPVEVRFAYNAMCQSRALLEWSQVQLRSSPTSKQDQSAYDASLQFVSLFPNSSLSNADGFESSSNQANQQDLSRQPKDQLKRFEELLPDDIAIVEFVEVLESAIPMSPAELRQEPRYGAFVLSRRPNCALSVRWFDLGSAKEIEEAIDDWQHDVGDEELATHVASKVWHPLESTIQSNNRIAIVPYRGLARVPWALLPNSDGDRAIDRYVFSCIHSAKEVIETRGHEPQYSGDLLAVGGLNYGEAGLKLPTEMRSATIGLVGARWQKLPQTLTEVENVRGFFAKDKSQLLVGEEALQESLTELMPNRRIIHFATHAYMEKPRFLPMLDRKRRTRNSKIPKWQSNELNRVGLVLSQANASEPGEESDSVLTGMEIANLQLGSVELVVLSACESGVGTQYAGEGPIGLQRAFHFAGARSVIASLWKVEDKAARLLMQRFYENLMLRGMAKADALRDAQIAMREGELTEGVPQPARSWAGWVLSGQDR